MASLTHIPQVNVTISEKVVYTFQTLSCDYVILFIKDGERSLVASRNISPLGIILTETPLVFCPDDLASCLVCGAEGAEQCAGCGHRLCPHICAEEHRGECRVLGQLRDLGLSLDLDCILLIRMLRIREEGGPAWDHIGEVLK